MGPRERLVIVAGLRTPFVRAGTELRSTSAVELTRLVFAELLARTGLDPAQLDEVILGCAGQPIEAQNLARVAALRAGIPEHVPAVTVHRNCASGMEALTQAALRIRAGAASLLLVGGVEAMSRAPVLFPERTQEWLMQLARRRSLGARLGHLLHLRPSFLKPQLALVMGLRDPVSGLMMGDTADLVAREFAISRDEQDAYALQSHQRAEAAREAGRLAEESIAVVVPPHFRGTVNMDTGIRVGLTPEKLGRLKPYFDRRHGTVTVGNACQLTDGAVALLVCAEHRLPDLGLEPLGYLVDHAYAGLDPRRMGLGPVYATHRLLESTGRKLGDFQRIELNEAFAAQVLACQRAFSSAEFCRREFSLESALGELEAERLNVNGGAIALGHPVGATGTRLVLTLLHELRRHGLRRGLATLCVGGGQGAALELEAA